MLRHMKHECGTPKRYSCSICQKKFTRRNYALYHESLVHGVFHETENKN